MTKTETNITITLAGQFAGPARCSWDGDGCATIEVAVDDPRIEALEELLSYGVPGGPRPAPGDAVEDNGAVAIIGEWGEVQS